MALSNNVIGAINFIGVLLSIPIISAGIWLTNGAADSCVKFLQWRLIILGVLILIVALAGFIGAIWRIQCLIIFYLIAMLVLIILVVCLVVFVYMVTIRGHGTIEPNHAYLEYQMDDFSGFLRRRVSSSFKWDSIRNCLSQTNMCAELNQSFRLDQDLFNAHLTPMQLGCCKLPIQCGYTFVIPSFTDCLRWSNDPTQLCYGCDSCKVGLLADLRKEWKTANVILIITVISIIVIYTIGFCAFMNVKTVTKNLFPIFFLFPNPPPQPNKLHKMVKSVDKNSLSQMDNVSLSPSNKNALNNSGLKLGTQQWTP
ncbi:hypothetical protein Lal_00027785 [Lupinus albus]|uniref:Putative tetraspanin/Peripherin n=1 Tax=Lupinus albus TaxID=3870 RepID=A0A6A4QIN8_LUPAL|nr:putative tetraspanin/Peripherin [Lupinus albus]KAF1873747.1 hypothetical protein Lal_00027785 [Lupinus albus]